MVLGIWMTLSGCHYKAGGNAHSQYLSNQENGLHQVQKGQWFEYQLQYQSADALTQQAIKAEGLPQSAFQEIRQNYEGHHYFLLSIKSNRSTRSVQTTLQEASQDQEVAEKLWQTLQYGLQPYLKLSCGKDTLSCVLCQAQAPVFKNGAIQVNLVFERESPPDRYKNEDLVWTSSIPAFPEAIPTFRIKRSDLNQLPTINL